MPRSWSHERRKCCLSNRSRLSAGAAFLSAGLRKYTTEISGQAGEKTPHTTRKGSFLAVPTLDVHRKARTRRPGQEERESSRDAISYSDRGAAILAHPASVIKEVCTIGPRPQTSAPPPDGSGRRSHPQAV